LTCRAELSGASILSKLSHLAGANLVSGDTQGISSAGQETADKQRNLYWPELRA
jgi:hypothetical protein